MDQELINQCTAEAQKWLSPAFDADTQAEVKAMRTRLPSSMLSIRIWSLVQVVFVESWVLVPTA